eukprot:TRINITY_DN66328_c10_g2_i2.p3 TRINITY_DN66328_c10_g2~~TRINITY_DN66328_c10_g2_i2.p3  ORF type:complete len:347 (+),score=200.20 TRINITY_DN66328_c10_g2_i2:446-1486(+)
MERMSSKDVYMFPIMGSAVLFSLYLVFKFLPRYYVNIVVKAYFCVFGVLVLAANVEKLIALIIGPAATKPLDKTLFRVWIPFMSSSEEAKEAEEAGGQKNDESEGEEGAENNNNTKQQKKADDGRTPISTLDLISLAISGGVMYLYLIHNHWTTSNLLGISFSIQGIEFLSLGSYFNGVVLLCGLFFYDIFWVFGTDVMVTVAKSFDAPIKLLFPRGGDLPHSLLGLGDIVIPGIFVALLLRFDYELHRRRRIASGKGKETDTYHGRPSSLKYFYTNMVGYVIGLATTLWVMFAFGAAQPALLYLVPACLGSSILCALLNGDMRELWAFTEGEEENQSGDGDKKNE